MKDYEIEMDEEEIQQRVEALTDEQKTTLKGIMTILLLTMESEDGCTVLMSDITGEGKAALMIVGNQLIAPQLAYCAADVLKQMEKPVGGMQ